MSESIIIGPLRFVADEHPEGVRMRVFAAECDGKGQIVTEGEWRAFAKAAHKPDDLDDETLAGFYRRIDALTERVEKAEPDRYQLRATVERLTRERDGLEDGIVIANNAAERRGKERDSLRALLAEAVGVARGMNNVGSDEAIAETEKRLTAIAKEAGLNE